MSLKVESPVTWNNEEYSGYEIVGVEWFFYPKVLNVLTEYFWTQNGKNVRRLIRHPFHVDNDVNVDELIETVHNYHK